MKRCGFSDEEADRHRAWLERRGMRFQTGPNPETDLTDAQIRMQLKMYAAALRVADDFGCDTIGIQYQQGLKDLLPASDLAEGLLNNTDRPPVLARDGKRLLYPGRALPHFNEVDECAGIDALVTHRVWNVLSYAPETTLHDIRWGEAFGDRYVWVFEISGAAPPEHFIGGVCGQRQRASASPVLPAWRGHGQGCIQIRRDRLEPHLRAGRSPEGRPGASQRRRVAAGRNGAPVGGHHAPVAHHACGTARA